MKLKFLRGLATFNLRPLTLHLFWDDLMKKGLRPRKPQDRKLQIYKLGEKLRPYEKGIAT